MAHSLIQSFFVAILPSAWLQSMVRSTNRWQIRCTTCGKSKTLWEAGGIRWGKAAVGSKSSTAILCSGCNDLRTGVVERTPPSEGDS